MGKKFHKVNVNIDNLLKINDSIDWFNSINKVLSYYIEDTEYKGTIKILDVVRPNKVVVQIDNENPITVVRESLIKTGLASYMGIKSRIFRYDVGDIIDIKNSSIIILEKKLIDSNTGYRVKCLKDNYEYDITSSNLLEALKLGHTRCPICCNHIIIDGINSLYDESKNLAEWFIDKNIPHRISRYSSIEQDLRCPNCGYQMRIAPQSIKTIPCCPRCGDGISYPEKMFSNVLHQLNIEYIFQLNKKHFAWCDKYRYDFYFEHNNKCYIFELDGGLGHGKTEIKPVNSLDRDNTKNFLAEENGIILVRIDVDYDNMNRRFDYIKNSICSSMLSELFDLNGIDWDNIKLLSNKSYLKLCCDEYNNGNTHIASIAKKYHISTSSVRRYLKIGVELNMCSYNSSTSWKNYMNNYYESNSQKYVKVIYDNKTIVCKGIGKVSRQIEKIFGVHITTEQIFRHLKNPKIKSRKGLSISYAIEEDYLNYLQYISVLGVCYY